MANWGKFNIHANPYGFTFGVNGQEWTKVKQMCNKLKIKQKKSVHFVHDIP